ncbi:hypothetical protein Pyn_33995 [Prunus yedoensis var. nudiflora]|uniref:Uncharacterized protein n=1 Tax=Prunus yedoensis var. nudiflora TaxID=2094558 RepID=A0A314UQM5_PRUYE|nr:hypothetical protein Pyn_33995 [Prunus yedoensis var. nudiflora]
MPSPSHLPQPPPIPTTYHLPALIPDTTQADPPLAPLCRFTRSDKLMEARPTRSQSNQPIDRAMGETRPTSVMALALTRKRRTTSPWVSGRDSCEFLPPWSKELDTQEEAREETR